MPSEAQPPPLWARPIGRGRYAALALLLALLKYNVDRVIVASCIGWRWMPWDYWTPGSVLGMLAGPAALAPVRGWLLLAAIPFVLAGVVLTLKRLRSAGWTPFLVLLFFVPGFNVALFIALCLAPARSELSRPIAAERRFLDRIVPTNQIGAAAIAVGLTVFTTLVLVFLSVHVLERYAWGLFVGLPFFMGMASATVYGYHAERTLRECLFVAYLSVLIAAGLALGIAIEGVICIAMAAPITLVVAFLGALVGYAIQRNRSRGPDPSLASLLVPLALLGLDGTGTQSPALHVVRTSIDVAAPPEEVWRHVIAFPEIAPPKSWLFRAGIAYPIGARIEGNGPGAVRRCVFSTGAFVEPIEVWDEPRLLRFSVTDQPAAMRELSPWPGTAPPHVDDFLVSRAGQFSLQPLPSGGTRLEGSTWYTHAIRPEVYWKPWSDWIIQRIHGRVLDHIKRLAEEDQSERAS